MRCIIDVHIGFVRFTPGAPAVSGPVDILTPSAIDRALITVSPPADPPTPRPDDPAVTAAAQALDEALRGMSPIQRRCFVLHHAHGFSYDEIAQRVGLPVNTVKSHVRRAQKRIEKHQPPQRRPAGLYVPSTRPYPDRLEPIAYPGHFEVRRVSTNGGIRWNATLGQHLARPRRTPRRPRADHRRDLEPLLWTDSPGLVGSTRLPHSRPPRPNQTPPQTVTYQVITAVTYPVKRSRRGRARRSNQLAAFSNSGIDAMSRTRHS